MSLFRPRKGIPVLLLQKGICHDNDDIIPLRGTSPGGADRNDSLDGSGALVCRRGSPDAMGTGRPPALAPRSRRLLLTADGSVKTPIQRPSPAGRIHQFEANRPPGPPRDAPKPDQFASTKPIRRHRARPAGFTNSKPIGHPVHSGTHRGPINLRIRSQSEAQTRPAGRINRPKSA